MADKGEIYFQLVLFIYIFAYLFDSSMYSSFVGIVSKNACFLYSEATGERGFVLVLESCVDS